MNDKTATAKTRLDTLHDGAIWRITLDAPKGNVIDATLVRELTEVFERAREAQSLKAILLRAEGKHFSFGASVEQHLPDQVADMLSEFHALFRAISASHVPVLAAVRGACLGGGLELVAFCHRVWADPSAKLGQPEIALGVFAPVGSAILAERVGRGAADDLLLSGRSVDAAEALALRLVDTVVEDPEQAAEAWAAEYLLPRSASSIRHATRAARFDFDRRFARLIEELEQLYLTELMTTKDAVEGIAAFLEKRPPAWSDQ